MKRTLSLLLALLMLALPLASCGGGDQTTTAATTTTTTAPAVTTQPPLPTPTPVEKAQSLAKKLVDEGFVFVGGSNAASSVEGAVNVVVNAAKDVAESKWDVVVIDDFAAREAGAKEVQLGKINRTEATGAYTTLVANRVNSSRDWRITVSADTVTVIAGSDDALVTALVYFAAMMKADANLFYPSYDTGIQRYTWDATMLGGVPVEQYKIVQSANADAAMQEVAVRLQANVFSRTGFTLPIVDDTGAATPYELVLGQTARPVSAAAQVALRQGRGNCAYDSIVYASERQIAITGGAYDAIVTSIDLFTRDFLVDSKQASAYNANALYQKEGIKSLSFEGNDAGEYRIVYAENAAYDLRYTAWTLQNLLYNEFGYLVEIVTDATPAVAGQKEILLGATNRPATTAQQLEKYSAKVDANGNVVFDAGHYIGVQRMYSAFLAELDSKSGDTLVVSLGYTGMVADIALSWYADKNLSYTVEGRQDALGNTLSKPVDRTYKNGDILEGFNFSDVYTLAWNEEFNGTSLNYEKWTHTTAIYAPDLAYSTEAPYIVVNNGKATLTAFVEEGTNGTYKYRGSYSLTTVDTMNFSGGYLELRAKVPFGGNGEFPSFWLRSTGALWQQDYRQNHDGALYDCGYTVEIDIFENFTTKDQISTNLIKWFPAEVVDDFGWGWHGGIIVDSVKAESPVAGKGQRQFYVEDTDAYHSFGFLWTDDLVAFAVDGKFYWSCPLEYTDIGNSDWDTFNPTVTIVEPNSPYGEVGEEVTFGMEGFKRDNMALFVLIDNFLYTEGLYGEDSKIDHSKDDEVFPIKYTLDYVRLYQCAADRIYTRSVYDQGYKLFSEEPWEYAYKGTGTPRA